MREKSKFAQSINETRKQSFTRRGSVAAGKAKPEAEHIEAV
jgi:hypothetical protein